LLEWRNLVCGVMIFISIMPPSLMAQESGGAMLHHDGRAWVNGSPAPNSSAIFPGDLIRTEQGTTAKVDAEGSTFTVEPETIVRFGPDELVLDHGRVQVNTWRGMKVRVDCLTVIPPAQEWARYDVIDVDGKVDVLAYQNDVTIHYHGAAMLHSKEGVFADVVVHQGGQATREERCGATAKQAPVAGASGAILNSVWVKGAGLVAIGVLTCWALCRGDEPVSPTLP
jgi:hypothetical protein